MAESFESKVWTELARELIERRDLRQEVRDALERALAEGDADAAAPVIRQALAEAVAGRERAAVKRSRAAAEDAERQRRERARARQSLSLVEHALARLSAGGEMVSTRLCGFLRDQVERYATSLAGGGAIEGFEAPQSVAERVLSAVAEHHVMARPLRVGILTPGEVAALAAGTVEPRTSATVRSTGDLERDLAAWEKSPGVDQARVQALRAGEVEDGQYVVAIIEPTADGHRIAIHPITGAGDTVPEPVETIAIPAREEPVPALQMMVEPAVRSTEPPRPQAAPQLGAREGEREARADLATRDLAGLRSAAVALNQARLSLYAKILEQRPDLDETARAEAERQLARMHRESEQVAALEPSRLAAFLTKWEEELTRDMGRLLSVSSGQPTDFDALSRLGALRHRLDSVRATVEGSEHRRRSLRGAGREDLVFARPATEPLSIFEGLSGPTIGHAARRAAAKAVSGESLTADVVARDAVRSARPAQDTRRLVGAIKAGGQQLQKAFTTMQAVHDSGLALSSQLQPLLRAAMPTDIRPDLRSPLMRNVLLPALERVSGRGRGRALARKVAQTGTAAPRLTPEALYGMMLGQTGLALVERRPEVAHRVLSQLAGLSNQLEGLAPGATAGALMRAGKQLADRVTAMIGPSESGSGEPAVAGPVSGLEVGEAMAIATGGAGGGPSDVIDDVTGALESEGTSLESGLREQVSPFLPGEVPYGQRVFQGAVTDLALDKMGASGATVGSDVFLRSGLTAQEKTAVAAHELTHVTQRAGGSVESMEQEAYGVESRVRDFLGGVQLAAEQPGPVQRAADEGAGEGKEGEEDPCIEEIADLIQRWLREAEAEEGTLHEGHS